MDGTVQLNPQQKQAVEAGDGPVVIVAGPGTGKTKTLAERIRYLTNIRGIDPRTILALTFTKKAAEEMQARVGQRGVQIATFHALCHKLLGGDHQFVAEPQRLAIIKSLPKPVAFKGLSTRDLSLAISRFKNTGSEDAALQKFVASYDAALSEQEVIDFDDLLVCTKTLLQNNTAQRQAVQNMFEYILVDEFQDTNLLQYELLQLMRGNDNVFVIGDPLQSIYGFRGASGSIFDQFKKDFPQHITIELGINYRSSPQIVLVANALFGGGLVANSQLPGAAQAVHVLNEYSEANWVMGRIQQAVGGHDMLRAVSDDDRAAHRGLRDFAVLYRNRSAALALQRVIDESGLPYQVVGDGSPYDNPPVQALLALLRACHTGDPVAIKGFTVPQCAALLGTIDTAQAPAELAQALLHTFGFEKTKATQQLISTLVRFDSLRDVIDYFDTVSEQGFYDATADAITLLTIHAAKGLEFSHVFLIGAEEGILPHIKADTAEEKRLFYVAATRAKEALDVTYATFRGGKAAQPSRFITALSYAVLPRVTDPNLMGDQRRAQKRKAKRSQTSLF